MSYTLRYRPVRLPPVITPLGKLTFKLRSLAPIFPARTYPLQEFVGIELRPPQPLAFQEFRRRALWYLQNFFTFACDRSNALKSIFVTVGRPQNHYELLFQHPFPVVPQAHPAEMLFTYPAVANRVSDLITRWIELYDRLGPVLNSIYSVIYGQLDPTDIQFLNVVQAAESYDRRMRGEMVVTPEEHAARVKSILAVAPEEHRDWLAGKLAHSSEPFLNERLTRLFNRLGDALRSKLYPSKKRMKSELWRIGEWRNALTHVTSDAQSIAENLRFMYRAMSRLIIAIKANLLLDLGFGEADLLECFRLSSAYHFASQQDDEDA